MYVLHLITIILALSFLRGFFVTGISCYECRSVSTSSHCVSDSGTTSDCDKKYCTIYRQEYLDPAGKIQHFYRSCEDAPTYLNAVIQTPNHRAYYRACVTDLCNSGDGIDEFTVGDLRNSSLTTVYLVPGTGTACRTTASWLVKLIVALISLTLLLPSLIIE